MLLRLPAAPVFPTRRSSDLVPDRNGSPGCAPSRSRNPDGGSNVGKGLAAATFPLVPIAGLPDLSRRSIDRKSTRLNSSHVKISYAVCWLKKKKQLDRPCSTR